MKLIKNILIPNFNYNNIYEKNRDYLNSKKNKIGVLVFLRYYGCTICQLDIREYNNLYEEFIKYNVDLKIVLQSKPEILFNADKEKKLKVEIVCDPDQKLYNLFELKSAKDIEELKEGNLMEKVYEARALGLTHGEYEGNELQLPGIFIVGKDNKILYEHYAKHGADIPRAKEVLEIIKKLSN